MPEISASAFAADFFHIQEELEKIRESGARSIHVDVMDGHFVPLFGFNQPWIRQMIEWDSMCGDIHLMAELNDKLVKDFLELPIQRLTVHVEAAEAEILKTYLIQICEAGVEAGLAISPWTQVEKLKEFLPYVNEILIMSCNPGTEGAVFQEHTYERIRKVHNMLESEKTACRIAVDGGLNEERALLCIKNGAERVIIGRAFLRSDDRKGVVKRVREASFGNL